jgi:secretion/DNA translocation related CpaE-like protein
VSLFALPQPDRSTPDHRSGFGPAHELRPALGLVTAPTMSARVVFAASSPSTALAAAVHAAADDAGAEVTSLDLEVVLEHWLRPRLLLLDARAAQTAAALHLPRRPGVVVVTDTADETAPWRAAVELGAEHVALLPEAAPWLASRIAEEDDTPLAPLVGVLGGCGGAGASTFAAALAVCAATSGHHVTLIDLDPLGAGIDVVLGGDDAIGARWEDLGDARGRVDGAALLSVLPRVAGVPLVTWRRDQANATAPPPSVLRAVLDSTRRVSDLVVLDLPRRLPLEADLPASLHRLVVVTPARVRAALSTARLLARCDVPEERVELLVRGPAPSGLSAADVARACGRTDARWLDAEPRRDEQEEHGVPPATGARGPLAEFSAALLAQLPLEVAHQ